VREEELGCEQAVLQIRRPAAREAEWEFGKQEE